MTNEEIANITLAVYRARLDDDSGKGAADRQVQKDGDDGEKQRRRSVIYTPIVVETLIAAGLHERPVRVPSRKAAE